MAICGKAALCYTGIPAQYHLVLCYRWGGLPVCVRCELFAWSIKPLETRAGRPGGQPRTRGPPYDFRRIPDPGQSK